MKLAYLLRNNQLIEFPNGVRYITQADELPESFVGADKVYADFETTSGDPDKDSLNAWHNCSVAGFGMTVDTCPYAIYFDYMHASLEHQHYAREYFQRVLHYAAYWINHNIKYDAQVGINSWGLQYPPWLKLKCTLVRAKIIDTDRGGARGGYGLDKLSEHWLGKDISKYEKALKVYLQGTKDYGDIPPDRLAEYGGQDVLTNRDLDLYIDNRMPERCQRIAETEMKLTRYLIDIEQRGLRFNPTDLKIAQYQTLNRICKLDSELSQIVGRAFRPTVNADCNEVLCGQYGLPVLGYTKEAEDLEEGEVANASFDKKVLALYAALPYAPQDVIGRIIEYRKLSQRNSLFLEPIQNLLCGELIHSNYNQIVRTGRMSCSNPNAQQMDDFIRGLILPPPGWSIISTDASQIEFRLIIHYIQDAAAIAAYNDDPNTDFYMLIANGIGFTRKPAKTLALATGYGEGKKKIIGQLSADKDIVAAVKAEVDALGISNEQVKIEEFNKRVAQRATLAYDAFHKLLPSLKSTSKSAEKTCKLPERRLGTAQDADHYYGYITNLYGRDRHLPYYGRYRTDYTTPDLYDKAWLAFSTLNQSTAADLMKERLCTLIEAIGELPIYPIAIVHDEIVLIAPTEIAEDFRTHRDIVGILEAPAVPISVPIRWSLGTSRETWLAAKTPVKDGGVSKLIEYNKAECTNFDFLR